MDLTRDFFFPDEVLKFRSQKRMKFGKHRYMIYLTNQRVIGYRRRGLLRRMDDVVAERLDKIDTIRHIGRKLEVCDENGIYMLKGRRDDVNRFWGQIKTCRLAAERLDNVQDVNYKERGFFRKTGILYIQTPQRRIMFEGKPEEIRALWKEYKKSAGEREIGFT